MMAASGMAAGAELFIQTDRGVKLRRGTSDEPKVGTTMIEGMKRRAVTNVQRQVNERVRQFGATHPGFNELKPLMSAMLEAAMPHLSNVERPNQITAPMLDDHLGRQGRSFRSLTTSSNRASPSTVAPASAPAHFTLLRS
jgi:hypothetical protein